jgi:hypothetical protein
MDEQRLTLSEAVAVVQQAVSDAKYFDSHVEDEAGTKIVRIKLKNGVVVSSVTLPATVAETPRAGGLEYVLSLAREGITGAARAPETKDFVNKLQKRAA